MVALNIILPTLSVFLLKTTHADIVKQLTEVIQANATLANNRAFVGGSATLFAPIFEYGCWCYLDPSTDYRHNAHARPVDEIDGNCKTLIGGYKCATIDAELNFEAECDAQTVTYTTFNFFASAPENLEVDCISLNLGSVCAQRACQIEGFFTLPFISLFFSGIDSSPLFDPNFVHTSAGGTFDPEVECAGLFNPVRSTTECCGRYDEGRKPFRLDSGFTTRSCCTDTVINDLIQECCVGVPVSVGSC